MTRRAVSTPAQPSPTTKRAKAVTGRSGPAQRTPAKPPTFVDFAGRFVRLSPAQRVLLKVSCDGASPCDLSPIEQVIANELFGSVDVIRESARSVMLWLLGRGAGKSTLAALFVLYQALTVDLSRLAPGEEALAPIVAVDTRQARICVRFALGFAKSRPEIARLISAPNMDGFTIKRGDRSVRISVLPATAGGGAARGRSIVGAILDEAAFWDDDGAEASLADMIGALSPRLLIGARIVAITSAWASVGQVFEWTQAQWGNPSTVLVAKGTTEQMRGADPEVRAMVARERARDPANARRELDCEFLSRDQGSVFDAGAVASCTDPKMPITSPPDLARTAFGGLDLGFSSDSSALVIVRIASDDVIEVVELIERRALKNQPLRPSIVLGVDFLPRLLAHGCSSVATDVHHEQVVREHLTGLRVVRGPDGAEGKRKIHTVAQDLINAGRVRMPRHPRLQQQLLEIQAKPRPNGGVAITSPRRRGRHGDTASGLIAAVYLASQHLAGKERRYFAPRNLQRSAALEALGEQASAHRAPVVARDRQQPRTEFELSADGCRVVQVTRRRTPQERWAF